MNTNKKLKILVIEDNQQMSEMISDHLQAKFPESAVSVFNSGEKALSETVTAPDIIILDYQLDSENPKALNGLQILMKMKKRFTAPVIFLTGQEKPEVSANIIKYGAYDYVVKNQQAFNKLETIVNNILEQKPAKKNPVSRNVIITLLIGFILVIAAVYILKSK